MIFQGFKICAIFPLKIRAVIDELASNFIFNNFVEVKLIVFLLNPIVAFPKNERVQHIKVKAVALNYKIRPPCVIADLNLYASPLSFDKIKINFFEF
jgi:hypothetical protein